MLIELATIGDLPVSQPQPTSGTEQRHHATSSSTLLSTNLDTPPPGGFRPMASSSGLQRSSVPPHSRPTTLSSNGNLAHSGHANEVAPLTSQRDLDFDPSLPGYSPMSAWNDGSSGPYMPPSGTFESLADMMPSYHSSSSPTHSASRFEDRQKLQFGHSASAGASSPFTAPDNRATDMFDRAWLGFDGHAVDDAAFPEPSNDTLTLLSTAPSTMEYVDLFATLTFVLKSLWLM